MRRWTPEMDAELRRLHGTMSIAAIADEMGVTAPSIRARVTRLGIAKNETYPAVLIADLRAAYEGAGADGVVNLTAIAAKWGREKGNLCRAARSLGLPVNASRRKVAERLDRRKFKGDPEALRLAQSDGAKARIAKNGHPRGMLGKKHTAEVRARIAEDCRARWAAMSEDERSAHTLKGLKTKAANGVPVAPQIARGSWKAAWREIGGKRNYYRSRWEANYARWLEHLKNNGSIIDWEHEPQTFWFDSIKRGVRSYKPDFRVLGGTSPDSVSWHEVKGWMDARSKTTLKRMAKYYPDEIIILVREPQYRTLCRNFGGLIEGWE